MTVSILSLQTHTVCPSESAPTATFMLVWYADIQKAKFQDELQKQKKDLSSSLLSSPQRHNDSVLRMYVDLLKDGALNWSELLRGGLPAIHSVRPQADISPAAHCGSNTGDLQKLFSHLLSPNTPSLEGWMENYVHVWMPVVKSGIHKLLGFTFIFIIKNILEIFLGHAAHFPSCFYAQCDAKL